MLVFCFQVSMQVQDGRSGVVLSLSRGNKEYPVPFCSVSDENLPHCFFLTLFFRRAGVVLWMRFWP